MHTHQGIRGTLVPGKSGETLLEVGALNTHAKFTISRPNGCVGLVVITHISVGSAFHVTEEFNPTSTAASMVQPSVLEVSSAGLIPYEALLLIQLMVEVSHHRFCLLRQ